MTPSQDLTLAHSYAGHYYCADRDRLAAQVELLTNAFSASADVAKGIIAPHAGLEYCGLTLGRAYAEVAAGQDRIRRVVVLGPDHREEFQGMRVTRAMAWATPLGPVPVDVAGGRELLALPCVHEGSVADHSLEVHLPLIRNTFPNAKLLPVLVGQCEPIEIATLLQRCWGGPETLIVVSSDLSHRLTRRIAMSRDEATVHAIAEGRHEVLDVNAACGWRCVAGLILAASAHQHRLRFLGAAQSADTVGTAARSVGYGAFALEAAGSVTKSALAELCEAGHRRLVQSFVDRGEPADYRAETLGVRWPGASFVSLSVKGSPIGCKGTLLPTDPLVADVQRNALRAAFDDARYRPLTAEQVDDISVAVSILGPMEAVPSNLIEEVATHLETGRHGLVIGHGPGSVGAVLLPRTWADHRTPTDFVHAAVQKAGWGTNWPADTRAWRFETIEATRRATRTTAP